MKGRPLFPGHYQPHLPADFGFYDLRVAETRQAQADLARAHGISGFCYYHYWFNGKQLLERPLNEVLRSKEPDFPFCVCWANENWTRRWDGVEDDVLVAQQYSVQDDGEHIRQLLPIFNDHRYIRIDGKPLCLIYRTELLPNPARTAEVWRNVAGAAGLGELYLARVENQVADVDPRSIGFDASVEFAPDWRVVPAPRFRRDRWDLRARIYYRLQAARLLSDAYAVHDVYSYRDLVRAMLAKPLVDYTRFRCVTPSWDNSVRRQRGAKIFHGSTPEQYETWLRAVVAQTQREREGDERIVFVNAWNEWAEGCHLEPDQRWGLAYLAATSRALACLPT